MRRQTGWLRACACTLLLAGGIGSAGANIGEPVTVQGATFAPNHEADAVNLRRVGHGVATARVFFDVYAAALYLPPSTPRGQILAADTPRRLEIQYLRAIQARDLIRAANTILERQHEASTLVGVREAVGRFHALYEDVEEGDRYAMTYLPGQGTELRLNGELKGRVPGETFARLYFGIWLGDDPLSESLRAALLDAL